MVFPTIPTTGAGRVVTGTQADTTATRTFPNLSGLTKNSGDLLIAIVVAYQSSGTANAVWSSWTSGWTEFVDSSSTTTMAIGAAYKVSTGSETGTISVTQAATVTGHAAFILLSIPLANISTAPAWGGRADGTTAAANPASVNPSGWDVEDTLWISVAGGGETATTGSFTGVSTTPPTNYSDAVATSISSDVVGGVNAGVAFRQNAAASEDAATWTVDLSSARNAALVIAVRPGLLTTQAVTAASTTVPTVRRRVAAAETATVTGVPSLRAGVRSTLAAALATVATLTSQVSGTGTTFQQALTVIFKARGRPGE